MVAISTGAGYLGQLSQAGKKSAQRILFALTLIVTVFSAGACDARRRQARAEKGFGRNWLISASATGEDAADRITMNPTPLGAPAKRDE